MDPRPTSEPPAAGGNGGGFVRIATRVTLRRPRATWFLLAAIAVYYAMTAIAGGPGDVAVILAFGANFGPLVAAGDVWRLVTSIFLHANLVHLLVNGYALFFLGRNLEAFYGAWGLLFLFLVSGVVGSGASAALSGAISVGASGGIFGLLGASIVFAFRYRGVLPRRVRTIMGTALLPWVAINVAFGFLVPVIDMNAHLGGLIAGAVAAFLVPAVAIEEALQARRRELPRFLASLCISLLLVSFLAAGRNIFLLRGESGALLDPRVAALVEDVDREEVRRRIEEELAANPDDTSLLSMRAELHMAAAEWAPAIADYRRVVALEPDHAGALNNLAWILLEEAPPELRDRAAAERLAGRALALEPGNPYVEGTYGTVRLRAGDVAEAIVHLRLALAVERHAVDEASDRYLLAIALAREGQLAEARELVALARRVDPENRYRAEAEAALERARPPGDRSI